MDNYGVSKVLLARYADLDKRKAETEKEISAEALANLGIKAGEIMRDKFTGLYYKVQEFHAYVNNGRVTISVVAYRYYRSGRREGRTANSWSFISFTNLEKLPEESKADV